jgi:mono/diheme cytochrome c family protein
MKLVTAISGLIAFGILAAACAAWFVTQPHPRFVPADALPDQGGDVEKGRLVFAAGDCASCHASPGQPDRFRLGGGMALASPYGTFRVPNISMDEEDGIGKWTTTDLANALLSGVSPQRQHYYPAFPYPSFAHMNVKDVRDLMAFLRTLPGVSGKTPPHDLSVPFRFRRALGFWKLLYLNQTPFQPDPSRDVLWNRGRYLTESVAHCAECHSSRNILGAIKPDTAYAGALDPEGVGYIPNITPAAIGDWSMQDISEVLKSGKTPNHGRVGSSMADVVTNTAMLPQEDRDAIASYIKSLPPRPTQKP